MPPKVAKHVLNVPLISASSMINEFSFRLYKKYNENMSPLPGKPAKCCKELKYELTAALGGEKKLLTNRKKQIITMEFFPNGLLNYRGSCMGSKTTECKNIIQVYT